MENSMFHSVLLTVMFFCGFLILDSNCDQCSYECEKWEKFDDGYYSIHNGTSANQAEQACRQCQGHKINSKTTLDKLKDLGVLNDSDDPIVSETLCSGKDESPRSKCVYSEGKFEFQAKDTHLFICVKGELSPPKLEKFELSLENRHIDLLSNPTWSLDADTKEVNLTCEACGYVSPCVDLLGDNDALDEKNISKQEVKTKCTRVSYNGPLNNITSVTCEASINKLEKAKSVWARKGCLNPCDRGSLEITKEAEVGRPLNLFLCVTGTRLQPEAFLNGTRVIRGLQNKHGTVWDFVLVENDPPRFNVTITLANITYAMAGNFTVRLQGRDEQDCLCYRTYTFIIITVIGNRTSKTRTSGGTKTSSTSAVTTSQPEELPEDSSSPVILIVLITFISVVTVVALLLACVLYRHRRIFFKNYRRRKVQSRQELYELQSDSPNLDPETDPCLEAAQEDINSGTVSIEPQPPFSSLLHPPAEEADRYISPEGLIYIIPMHTPSKSRRPGTAHKSRDHVEYATLDRRYTGKLNLDNKDDRNKLKQLEKDLKSRHLK